jgi:NTE family protein
VLGLCGLLLVAHAVALAQPPPPVVAEQTGAPAQDRPRPQIGLALGGGAARGLAHLGVLEWLEAHRIPVDVIAGTSIGGLIGAGYASGMSPAELRELMRATDWDLMFLVDSPFKYKTFRRKEEARAFPGQIDLGLKGGLTFPSGLNPGQQLQLLLDRLAAPYYDLATFDDLPVRFRAVATDLQRSELVVLGTGSLAQALRATMAVPGLLTPVEIDGRLLVDGGTLNNVPADVVRALGADVVIAVNVGSSNYRESRPRSLFEVMAKAVDAMMIAGVRAALRDADVVVTPPLQGYTGLEFRESDALADLGYRAAEELRAELLPHAVDEAAYDAWRRARNARRRTALPVVGFVSVEGVPSDVKASIERRLGRRIANRTLDRSAVEREILQLSGSDRYEVVRYAPWRDREGRVGVRIDAKRKSWGPPFLLPALDLQNVETGKFALDLRGRIVVDDVPFKGSELRTDFTIGSRQAARVEAEQRVAGSRVFVRPRAQWSREDTSDYARGRLVAESRRTTTGVGVDVGLDLGLLNEVRLGYDVADVRVRRRVGDAAWPEIDGRASSATLQWTFDGQTSPVIPTRGLHSRAWLVHHFDAPDLLYGDDRRVEEGSGLTQAEVRLSYFRRLRHRHRLFAVGEGGTSFGRTAGANEFRLGGLLRLGAVHVGELRGDHYLAGAGGVLYELFRLPELVGGSGFLGAWYETGTAFDHWDRAQVEHHLSGGLVLETAFGPLYVGGSFALDRGDRRFYVNLGPVFR